MSATTVHLMQHNGSVTVVYDSEKHPHSVLHQSVEGAPACGVALSRAVEFSDYYSHVVGLLCAACDRGPVSV